MVKSSINLCQYKDILGKPGEGIRRRYRLFNISIIDFVLTIVLGVVLAHLFKIQKINGILIAFLLGIISHKVFCVDTTIAKWLNSLKSKQG